MGKILNVFVPARNNCRTFFCRHKNTEWMKKVEKFQNLSGETRYLVCQDCGKVIDTMFVKHE